MTRVSLLATGLQTALGTGSEFHDAAVRGGATGVREHPWMVSLQGEPVYCAMAFAPDPEPTAARWCALIDGAWGDAMSRLENVDLESSIDVVLCLPRPRPGLPEALESSLVAHVRRHAGERGASARVHVVRTGAAGAGAVLARAQTATRHRLVIIGVDTWIEPTAIETLDRARQLHRGGHGAVVSWGLVPGEGAAVLVLTTDEPGPHAAAVPVLHAVGLASEPTPVGSSRPIVGRALAGALGAAVGMSADDADLVVSDFGAAPWRAEEWALAALASPDTAALLACEMVAPADRWGDLGAATLPALIALAAGGLAVGRRRATRALVVTMCADGDRAVVHLERPAGAPHDEWPASGRVQRLAGATSATG
jgi:3-oxoacyl-[acyl-carrier-protein] synthase-1